MYAEALPDATHVAGTVTVRKGRRGRIIRFPTAFAGQPMISVRLDVARGTLPPDLLLWVVALTPTFARVALSSPAPRALHLHWLATGAPEGGDDAR